MILDNSTYNKVKLVYKISQIIWFIDKHGLIDANSSGDKDCMDSLIDLRRDLERHLEKLQKSVCIISQ